MKYPLFIACLALSLNAFSASGKLSLKCEEGVGNRSNPIQFVHVEGTILDINKRGEMDLQDKNALKILVSNNGHMIPLNENEYRIDIENEIGTVINITLLTEKSPYTAFQIQEVGGPELIVKAIGASRFTGSQKVIGGGVCWGFSPYANR